MTAIPVLPVVTVTISGEIDIATSRAMCDALATGPGPAHLEVDMSAVTFMDASGIGVLLAARQQAVDGGGSLTVRAPSGAVRRLTGVLGLDELLATREPRPTLQKRDTAEMIAVQVTDQHRVNLVRVKLLLAHHGQARRTAVETSALALPPAGKKVRTAAAHGPRRSHRWVACSPTPERRSCREAP